jgi:hypothetical protein
LPHRPPVWLNLIYLSYWSHAQFRYSIQPFRQLASAANLNNIYTFAACHLKEFQQCFLLCIFLQATPDFNSEKKMTRHRTMKTGT